MYPLIGLKGNATAGKDASGRVLVERHGYTRVAFCDGIGAIARGLGWNGDKANGGREFLQLVGGAVRGALGEAAFIVPVLQQAITLLESDQPVVVTDVRMVGEFEAIMGCGGIVVEVQRPGVGVYNTNTTETALLEHQSSYIIHNDGDWATLERRVQDMLTTPVPTGLVTTCAEGAVRVRQYLAALVERGR